MDLKEKTINSEYKFEGRIIKVRVDKVELPNGNTSTREVCDHVGGVAVVPIDKDGNIILVRQYRYPYDDITLEIPAGKIDKGPESIEQCGRRELLEETGLLADKFVNLGRIYPSPGFLNEVLHLFLATELTQSIACPDDDEFVEVVKIPIAEVEQMILDDKIRDAKTICALYRAKLLMNK